MMENYNVSLLKEKRECCHVAVVLCGVDGIKHFVVYNYWKIINCKSSPAS